jgi:transposase
VIGAVARFVTVPSLGTMHFRDKGRLLRAYLEAGVEACQLIVKRQGKRYYACIAVRGLQPYAEHPNPGSAIGLDMGVVNPITRSDGQHVTRHQGLEIAAHLARLERRKLRVKRRCSRKLRAAARRAGAITETGGFTKGVRLETSNRLLRAIERINKIDRQIVGYRADWQRHQALQIVSQSEIVVVEALRIANMTRSAAGTAGQPGRNVRAKAALNRSILARGWGSMRARLKNKAEELCGRVIEIDPRHTSQQCPNCGHTDSSNRKTQAQFACVACGYTEHADIVGATNILARGLSTGALPAAGRGGYATGQASSHASSEQAIEPSNKTLCEPAVFSPDAVGSHNAKQHDARVDGGGQAHASTTQAAPDVWACDGEFDVFHSFAPR